MIHLLTDLSESAIKHARLLWRFFITFFIIQVIAISVILAVDGLTVVLQTREQLRTFVERITTHIQYEGGRWDITRYTADTATPHPNGSGGYTDPLYVFTADGFVIERTAPISGFFDSSDYKNLQSYNEPTTITTQTNEQWRMLTSPITANGETKGIIVISYYNPQETSLDDVDAKLRTALTYLNQNVRPTQEGIDVSRIQVNEVAYDVSFEIVTNFNKVVVNSGRIPTFIDPSYIIDDISHASRLRLVTDTLSGHHYLVISEPLKDNNNHIGLIVAGKSLETMYQSIRTTGLLLFALSLVTSLLFAAGSLGFIRKYRDRTLLSFFINEDTIVEQSIIFNTAEGILTIGNEKTIKIPPETNQHHLLKLFFNEPDTHWTQEQLAQKLGFNENDETRSKSIYDSILSINKKIGFKFIEYKNKHFYVSEKIKRSLLSLE